MYIEYENRSSRRRRRGCAGCGCGGCGTPLLIAAIAAAVLIFLR